MNKNMKRLLIFALVPITVWGIGSTYRAIKADRIAVDTESQITMSDTVRFSSGTATTVPYLDANKDLVSSAVTPTELGYVSGVTSALQTQIDGKEGTLTNSAGLASALSDESGTGVVLFGTNPAITSPDLNFGTASNSIRLLLPNDTTTNLDLLTDTAGLFAYDTTLSKPVFNDGTGWTEVGSGGGGGSNLNLFADASFEQGVANGTCTSCTASQETSVLLATAEPATNTASLKMAFSASSGDYTWTETTGSQYSNVAGQVKAWIKTSASDCHFVEMVDGAETQTVEISSSDEWKEYIINGTMGATSYGYRVECNTSITDDVYVDETFAGAATADTFDIGTSSLWGSVKWSTTANCQIFSSGTGSWADFPADVDCDDNARTIKGTYNSTNGAAANSDGQKLQVKFSYIPAGYLKCSAYGFIYGNTAATDFGIRFSDGTNSTATNLVYGQTGAHGRNVIEGVFHYTTPQTSETTIIMQAYAAAGAAQVYIDTAPREFEISCYHYPSPQKVVAAKCDGLECVNEFSARVNGSATISDENVDWLSSASFSSPTYTINFQSGLFSSAPNCQLTPGPGYTGNYFGMINTVSASSINVAIDQDAGTASNFSFVINCQRSGSDYKQFDQRMVRVIQEEAGDNWTSFTPTSNWVSNTTHYGKWRRNGDSMEISYSLQLTGAPTAAQLAVDMPSGYSIDTAKLPSTGTFGSVQGVATVFDSGTAVYTCSAMHNSSNKFLVYCGDGPADKTVSSTQPITFASGDAVNLLVTVPIQGWKKDVNAFIGNLTPKEFVQTPGSTKPVMYSATISSTGVVSNEIGTFINGDCTNAATSVCTLESGAFSGASYNCTAGGLTAGDDTFCSITSSSGSFSIGCLNSAGSGVSRNKRVICHGVQ